MVGWLVGWLVDCWSLFLVVLVLAVVTAMFVVIHRYGQNVCWSLFMVMVVLAAVMVMFVMVIVCGHACYHCLWSLFVVIVCGQNVFWSLFMVMFVLAVVMVIVCKITSVVIIVNCRYSMNFSTTNNTQTPFFVCKHRYGHVCYGQNMSWSCLLWSSFMVIASTRQVLTNKQHALNKCINCGY